MCVCVCANQLGDVTNSVDSGALFFEEYSIADF